jgi:methylated-DNA-[protein]-cysteine S-methyltransferase
LDHQFTVETKITSLAVALRDGVVIQIKLNQRADCAAESPLERRVSAELQEYAAGERTEFTFPIAPVGTEFDHQVWDAVAAIPYGETRTYGEIATSIGKPGAARAVGTANGRNPVPPVIPCHRVVAAGGKLGGYGGGLDLKRRLLALESVRRAGSAFLVGALLTAAVLSASACADPARPDFGAQGNGSDTLAPRIQFISPAVDDSVFPPGSRIDVVVSISDETTVVSVGASVIGAVSLEFPSIAPASNPVEIQYPISVPLGTTGHILLRVVAIDSASNQSQADRQFVIE